MMKRSTKKRKQSKKEEATSRKVEAERLERLSWLRHDAWVQATSMMHAFARLAGQLDGYVSHVDPVILDKTKREYLGWIKYCNVAHNKITKKLLDYSNLC